MPIEIVKRRSWFIITNFLVSLTPEMLSIKVLVIFLLMHQKRYTYAFNLSRGLHGDKRTISALSMNSLPEQERNILTGVHKNTYGITPATKGDVIPVRDSKAIYTSEIKDSFSFSSLWSEGGKQPSSVSVLVHKGIKQTEDGDVDVQDTYQVLTGSGARPLSYKGFPIYQLDVDVKETIYKYSTAVMEVGKTLLLW